MKDTINTFLLHRLTIGWVLLFSFNSLCASIMTALAGTDWTAADAQTKFLIVVAIAAGWTNTLMAFFNSAANRVKDGKSLLPPGGTNPPTETKP